MRTRYRLRGGFEWDGASLGSIIYFDADGVGQLLPIPGDWSTVEYVLGISAGVPAWLPAEAGTIGFGFGNGFGNSYGGTP
jgi:hypothetical protein